jgi:cbb3-type cytochrome oxidase subunit 3
MYDIWMWFTDLGNSKITALLIFFPLFVGIVIYTYTNKKRSKRLESYKYMPFDDDQDEIPTKEQKVKNNG